MKPMLRLGFFKKIDFYLTSLIAPTILKLGDVGWVRLGINAHLVRG